MSEANVLVEPAYVTAGKQRVQDLQRELSIAKSDLSQSITDWKAGLDAGYTVEKDEELANVIAANARLQSALDEANALLAAK